MAETVKFRLLSSATATGDGPVIDLTYPMFAVGVQAEFPSTVTVVTLTVKGLIDGATYDTVATLDTTAGYKSGAIVVLQFPLVVTQLKANISALTGTGGVSVYCAARR